MGTRNVTSVVFGGKQVVCQYGQWDGYPSWTGVKILEFLRDVDRARFVQTLENTKITVVDYEDALTYTGSTKNTSETSAKVWKAQAELNNKRKLEDEYWGPYKTVKHLLKKGVLTEAEVDDYIVSTRDTGCEILDYIYNRSLDKGPLELFAITEEFNGEYSWDIQGIYVLDLDKNILRMTYDGYLKEFNLDDLPKKIDKEMLTFEKITRKLCEVDFDNMDITTNDLFDKANELAVEVGSEIREEYPELIDDAEGPVCVESFGRDYIFEMLCSRLLKKENKGDFVGDLIAAVDIQSNKKEKSLTNTEQLCTKKQGVDETLAEAARRSKTTEVSDETRQEYIME